jgi:hypothetical protein
MINDIGIPQYRYAFEYLGVVISFLIAFSSSTSCLSTFYVSISEHIYFLLSEIYLFDGGFFFFLAHILFIYALIPFVNSLLAAFAPQFGEA